MASTYSNLKIELIGTGEQTGTWGATTNTNLGTAIEEAIVGYATANFASDADLTLTLTDSNATQVARNLVLNVTSGVSLSTTRNLVVPTIEKPYYIFNNTTGGQSITVKTTAGTGVVVPNGSKAFVFTDGTNVVPAINAFPVSASLTFKLPTTDGTPNQVLVTDGSGGLSFSSSASLNSPLTVIGNNTAGASIRLPEDTDNGSSYVALKAPDALAGNATLTIPELDGATLGFLNIPQSGSDKTTSYSLTTADIGKVVGVGSGGSITVPDATFANGDAVLIFNNTSGNVTLTMSITTAYIAGTDADKATITLATRGVANILFISGTVCVVTGNVS